MTATIEREFRSIKIGGTFFWVRDGQPIECVRTGPRVAAPVQHAVNEKGDPVEWRVALSEKVRIIKP